MKRNISIIYILFIFVISSIASQGKTIYVNYSASGTNNGTSWANAFTSFQSGLNSAASGDRIWVATGTYKPNYDYGEGGSRFNHFQLKSNVAIYGGFSGTEASDFNLNSRDITVNETILSGDIGTPGDNSDNCYHVIHNPGGMRMVTSTAILDGFTISGGYADGSNWPNYNGAGMCNYGSSPTINNCTFKNNYSRNGAAIANEMLSSSVITNCVFNNNDATNYGGAVYNTGSTTTMTNCTISLNSATNAGGGIYNRDYDIVINNSIIWDNTCGGSGNQINTNTVTISYSCYSNGTNDIIGSTTVSNCINSNPVFSAGYLSPFSLYSNSPCINSGNNSYISISIDSRGQTRIQNSTIDMGAYEWTSGIDPIGILSVTTKELTNITSGSAISGGKNLSDGGSAILAKGVCWSLSHDPTISDYHTTDGTGTSTYTTGLTGLSCNTTYYARAYVTNSDSSAYGCELSFTTPILADYPTIQTYNLEFTNVSQTSATLSWTKGNGSKRILLKKSSEFGSSDIPADGTIYSAGTTFNGMTVIGIYDDSQSSVTFSDLTVNTVYYYKICEYNENTCSASQAYQNSGFGATNPVSLKTAPNQTNNLLVRSFTKTYFDLEWVRGNGSGCMMTCVKGTTTDVINPLYGSTDYSSNSNFASGDRIGTATPENYVVYKGTGTSCRISGLSRNTQYSMKVFEYNYFNSYFSYATNTSSGNPRSKTTLAKPGFDAEGTNTDTEQSVSFTLSPVPANEYLYLSVSITEPKAITVKLFNMDGNEVLVPINNIYYQSGKFELPISILHLTSGTYYIVLSSNNEVVIQDFVIVH